MQTPNSDEISDININKWLAVSVAVYIFWVFNFLEPFGISVTGFNLIYHSMLSSYAVVSALTVLLTLSTLNHKFEFDVSAGSSWWVVAFVVVLVFLVSFTNWLYSLFLHKTISGWHNMYVPVYKFSDLMPQFVALYAIWGFICLAFILLVKKLKVQPNKQSEKDTLITLYSENQSDGFKVKPAQIVCFKTSDNYLEVFYLNESDELQNRMIRSSMKKMEGHVKTDDFFRSHQSFLVNQSHIKGLKKIKSSHLLEMAYLDFDVPVSRNKVKDIKVFLQKGQMI